jgi:hypothetical protein
MKSTFKGLKENLGVTVGLSIFGEKRGGEEGVITGGQGASWPRW